ncbi:MAG: cysteine protease [Oceanospirillaceae bacterium]|jgi:transglutaminase-like putative cysteine protease|nr:cysteine protease [Oceanospirillaceae bacterium]
MWLQTRCELNFEIEYPTPFVLMLRPRSGAQQWIAREEYRIEPNIGAFEFTDGYGNLCQRLIAPPGSFSIMTEAEVMTADHIDLAPGAPFIEIQNLPDSALEYLLPSRFCESDRLSDLANRITDGMLPGYDQVAAIERWVHEQIVYEPATSAVPVSATEIAARGAGVCRDLAHLSIALCRNLSIPARMVVGYLYELEPMDLHAWFEAYVGGRWYTFDPTQKQLRPGYVAIGYGRDAADVAIYNQFGPPVIPLEQHITVKRLTNR